MWSARHLAWLIAVSLLHAAGSGVLASDGMEMPGIHNFHRATANVFSGSQPEGEAAFAALAKLGVKTIVSVDGARPDVALAAQHGLRYVHLPIGYDGIASNRVVELAQAAAVLPGPIFVHCHHGLHRGPAAVAAICRTTAGWDAARATNFMHGAGTAPDYAGLYRSVRELQPPSAAALLAVGTNFPAIAQTTSLVDAMVAIDTHFDQLKAAERGGWKTGAATEREALLLLEQFRELVRAEDAARRPADYRAKLATSLRASETLHTRLKSAGPVAESFGALRQSCVECHRRYRNE